MARCRSCHEEIIWRRLDGGGPNAKAHPIDAQPAEFGNIVLVGNDRYRVLSAAERVNQPSIVAELRYVSHFATCAEAGKWRGSR